MTRFFHFQNKCLLALTAERAHRSFTPFLFSRLAPEPNMSTPRSFDCQSVNNSVRTPSERVFPNGRLRFREIDKAWSILFAIVGISTTIGYESARLMWGGPFVTQHSTPNIMKKKNKTNKTKMVIYSLQYRIRKEMVVAPYNLVTMTPSPFKWRQSIRRDHLSTESVENIYMVRRMSPTK